MPKLFISYRRKDSGDVSEQIGHELERHFGEKSVFIDVDSIPGGADYRAHIHDYFKQTNVLIAVIGAEWLSAQKDGQRRIDDPQDLLRIELETAIATSIPIFPVLVNDALMPSTGDLPESLHKLCDRNAIEVHKGGRFYSSITRLIGDLEALLKDDAIVPYETARERAIDALKSKIKYKGEFDQTAWKLAVDMLHESGYIEDRQLLRQVNSFTSGQQEESSFVAWLKTEKRSRDKEKTKRDRERQALEKAERERKAQEELDHERLAQEEAERQQRIQEEARRERQSREEAERKQEVARKRQARENARLKLELERERETREELERKGKAVQKRRTREKAELKLRAEQERQAKEEAERKVNEMLNQRGTEEVKHKLNEELESKQETAQERQAWEKAELKLRVEQERQAREGAERTLNETLNQQGREEAKRNLNEDLDLQTQQTAQPDLAYESLIGWLTDSAMLWSLTATVLVSIAAVILAWHSTVSRGSETINAQVDSSSFPSKVPPVTPEPISFWIQAWYALRASKQTTENSSPQS